MMININLRLHCKRNQTNPLLAAYITVSVLIVSYTNCIGLSVYTNSVTIVRTLIHNNSNKIRVSLVFQVSITIQNGRITVMFSFHFRNNLQLNLNIQRPNLLESENTTGLLFKSYFFLLKPFGFIWTFGMAIRTIIKLDTL